ncbi:dihydroorotate dehydrogenase [Candidatus Bathyarchaeota archaeon]|nr:dihydroorotate dehydrogenase [Candidatus Bathyarchaeota archaeon]
MPPTKVDLTSRLAGLSLRNPLILASGILGSSGAMLREVARECVGAVTTKSFGTTAREGYQGPVITEVAAGYLNSLGLPNPGSEQMKAEIKEARKGGVPVIASIYGFTEEEYGVAATAAQDAGADALELNVSCPHVEEVGLEIGRDPDLVARVTSASRSKFNRPLIVKLSPNVGDIVEIAEAAAGAGAEAITAVNTVRAIAIDVEMRRPILGGRFGGLSGPAIKPIALRCVYELYEKISLPIIGCGGITGWQDAVEYLLAGASAVQIGSALVSRDFSVFKEISEGLGAYLSRHGYTRLEEIVGIAHA